jgi:heterodisulfide reductase subunit A-like polyferredoxin
MSTLSEPVPKPVAVHDVDQTVGALVIGGDYQGLGIVRSLGRQGIPVCVVDDELSISR